jgi:5-methylcytosine-specific restriction endonuclease McrA
MRHRARYNLKLKPGDAREVDHKKPLSKGGSNSRKNIRLVSKKTNRKKAAK